MVVSNALSLLFVMKLVPLAPRQQDFQVTELAVRKKFLRSSRNNYAWRRSGDLKVPDMTY
jgi:hypothetical protein